MDNRGLTLIEVILAIVIISLIAMVSLTIFNMGLNTVTLSGERTLDIYKLQEKVDGIINDPSNIGEDDTVSVEERIGEIEVTIDGVIEKQKVSGKFIDVEIKNAKRDNPIRLITFIPFGKED